MKNRTSVEAASKKIVRRAPAAGTPPPADITRTGGPAGGHDGVKLASHSVKGGHDNVTLASHSVKAGHD